jgi:hypothetical protein
MAATIKQIYGNQVAIQRGSCLMQRVVRWVSVWVLGMLLVACGNPMDLVNPPAAPSQFQGIDQNGIEYPD